MSQNQLQAVAKNLVSGYKGGENMPLAGYLTLLGVFNSALVAFLAASNTKNEDENKKNGLTGLIILGLATFKLARVISKDRVTSPLRAPFTEYVEPDGTSEVKEKSRGTGLQRAIGDLITCPWCMSPWVAGALTIGYVFKPRATRILTGIFAAVAVADFLQHGYNHVKEIEK